MTDGSGEEDYMARNTTSTENNDISCNAKQRSESPNLSIQYDDDGININEYHSTNLWSNSSSR